MSVDKPLSNQFLNIINNEIVTGTIPRDYETRPHVQVSEDDRALRGQGTNDVKVLGLVGKALNGIPNHVYKITSMTQAKQIFGGGELVDAIELAWQPNMPAYGENGTIYAERVENAGQSSLNAGALHFVSKIYGDKANNIQVSLKQNNLNNTWTITVTNKTDGYHQTYNNLGLLANISYTPNSWSKYNKPANAKDYARASYEIKPRTVTRTINGKKDTTLTGQAGELILHFHDTKNPATLHNNLTNNIDSGSTIYEENGSEVETSNSADKGDKNPNVGPFIDWSKSYDLTSNRYQNIWSLLKDIQNLNGINIETVNDHNISHIQANLLNLTNGRVNIIPNLDDTTTDKDGNIIEPAGIWSTLGDIVDKMRSDTEVSVSADLSHQLNHVNIKPQDSNASEAKALAKSLKSDATSASTQAELNSDEAQSAYYDSNALNNESLYNEFNSIAQSENSVAVADKSNASKYSNYAKYVIDNLEYNTAVENSSAASIISKNTSELNSAENIYNSDAAMTSSDLDSENYYTKLANSCQSSADSVNSSIANSYESNANSDLNNNNRSAANSARSSASYYNSLSSNSKAVSYMNMAHSYYAERMGTNSTIRSLENEIKSAKNNISSAITKANKNNATKSKHIPHNMQMTKNKVSSYIKQINKATKNNDLNVVDSDIRKLDKIAKYLANPPYTYSTQEFHAGVNMQSHMRYVHSARANLLTDKHSHNNLIKALLLLNTDLQSVPSDQPAPESLFSDDYGDGEIDVLDEPIHAFKDTNLTGGYTKPTPLSWAKKFHLFDDTPVYDMVALTPSSAVHAELASYIDDRYFANHNMQGFVGGGFNESTQTLIGRANDLDNERMHLVGSSMYYLMEDGRVLHVPAYMSAALVAGIDASIPVSASVLNKEIEAAKLDKPYSNGELNALDENGVIMFVPVINHGVASKYVIGDDVSTANDGSDPVKSELQLSEDNDFICDDYRMFLQHYLGSEVNAGTASNLKSATNSWLEKEQASANNGGLIQAYDSSDINVEVRNETVYIVFNCVPIRTLKHIYARIAYDGYDEQATNTTSNNFYIGSNGRITQSQNEPGINNGNGDATNNGNGSIGQNDESPD